MFFLNYYLVVVWVFGVGFLNYIFFYFFVVVVVVVVGVGYHCLRSLSSV